MGESSGSALDSTSNDNDGTFNGTMPNQVSGQLGDSQDVNGTGDFVQIGDDASLDVSSGMTLSAWTYAGTDPVTYPVQIGKAPINKAYLLGLDIDDKLIGRVTISAAFKDAKDTSVISRGSWNSFSVTHDSSDVRLFRAGSEVASATASGSQDATAGDLYFGNADGTSTNRYVGRLDEVRISSVARSATWISTEYNNQSAPGTFNIYGGVIAAPFRNRIMSVA